MYSLRTVLFGSFATVLVAATGPSHALEYRSLAEPAILYDAPSKQAKPLYIIARYTPVEVVINLEGWVKVRDAAGTIVWVEKRVLSPMRMVIVTARADVYQQPDNGAPLVFAADKDVVLELVETGPVGWAKVKHRDGATGFVRVSQIWGL